MLERDRERGGVIRRLSADGPGEREGAWGHAGHWPVAAGVMPRDDGWGSVILSLWMMVGCCRVAWMGRTCGGDCEVAKRCVPRPMEERGITRLEK